MRTAATRVSVVRRRVSGWRYVTWILVLAFSLQSYVAQTHIHITLHTIDRAAAGKPLASTPAHNKKSPAEDGTDACPFCQAVANASAFFAPAAPLVLPPALWADPSHCLSWQARLVAPPPTTGTVARRHSSDPRCSHVCDRRECGMARIAPLTGSRLSTEPFLPEELIDEA